jgi:hypothetical protein
MQEQIKHDLRGDWQEWRRSINVTVSHESIDGEGAPVSRTLPDTEGNGLASIRVLIRVLTLNWASGEGQRLLGLLGVTRNVIFPKYVVSVKVPGQARVFGAHLNIESAVRTSKELPPSLHGCQSTLVTRDEAETAW